MSTEGRFEPRPHPTSTVPGILAAWDHKHNDWVREPGRGREPQVFVSEAQIQWWAEKNRPKTDQPAL